MSNNAHTKEEQLYHPDFYKTIPCHSNNCQRYCPFGEYNTSVQYFLSVHNNESSSDTTPLAVPPMPLSNNNRFIIESPVPSMPPPMLNRLQDMSDMQRIMPFREPSTPHVDSGIYTSTFVSELIHIANLGNLNGSSRADDILRDLWNDIEHYRTNCSLENIKCMHYSSALEKALMCLKISNHN
eukprot:GHVH01002234.1.p1 GENE.GHVH01002234.1~~GHVH01002234.1.p1  ORF type:complete len:191 (+),score=20.06 GHVH01002234.1:25-573(+)